MTGLEQSATHTVRFVVGADGSGAPAVLPQFTCHGSPSAECRDDEGCVYVDELADEDHPMTNYDGPDGPIEPGQIMFRYSGRRLLWRRVDEPALFVAPTVAMLTGRAVHA